MTLKSLNPKNLGLKNLGPWKGWTLKNLDHEKHEKHLDAEQGLKDHIALFLNNGNLLRADFFSKPSRKVVIEAF